MRVTGAAFAAVVQLKGVSLEYDSTERWNALSLTQVRQLGERRKKVSEEKACAEFPRYEGNAIRGGM